MTDRGAARVAWAVAGLAALMAAAGTTLAALTPDDALPKGVVGADPDFAFGLVYLAFAAIGALIASRQPRNPIGWLFQAFGLVGLFIGVAGQWALHSLYAPGSALPGGAEAAWLAGFVSPLLLSPLVLVLLLFPDGHVLTRRWRAVAHFTWAITLLLMVVRALDPGPLDNLRSVSNPFGVESAADVLGAILDIGYALGALPLLAASVALVLRFRRSRGREREQLKWFVSGAVLSTVLFGSVLLTTITESARASTELTAVTDVLVAIAFVALPASAGIAILRHRLFDIDVVVNRTLVYGALTATLAGAYTGSVLLLQLVLSPGSDLAIAASTLAVAALFRPLRGRIQEAVDRRFYRRRYDAQHTLDGFGSRLRDEIDLDSLGSELRGVVTETMQPAHTSLWLRNASRTPSA